MTETPRSFPQTFFQPDADACQILLVRHGQSAPFVEGTPFPLVDGQGNPPLSPLGQWQAEQVGIRLADEPIDAIYASTLQRTSQTAAPLAKARGLKVNIDADLREIHLGIGEGGEFRRMAADGHPATTAMRENLEWGEIPGAESNAELTARNVRAIRRIASKHRNQFVAVFCHGGVIGALAGHALGVNPFRLSGSRNGSFCHIVVHGSNVDAPWILRSFNDAAHTGPLTADADPPT